MLESGSVITESNLTSGASVDILDSNISYSGNL